MPKKWLIISVCLLAFWGIYSISFNIVRHSGYYAQHLPHKDGTNPELIFTLKHLYYLEKPDDKSLRYDYDGMNAIIVNEEYFLSSHKEPKVLIFNDHEVSPSYHFDKQGKFQSKDINDRVKQRYYYIESPEAQMEATKYVERAIRPILDVQIEPDINLQWLFNLIYQRQFD